MVAAMPFGSIFLQNSKKGKHRVIPQRPDFDFRQNL
jgi:hypothetical protein